MSAKMPGCLMQEVALEPDPAPHQGCHNRVGVLVQNLDTQSDLDTMNALLALACFAAETRKRHTKAVLKVTEKISQEKEKLNAYVQITTSDVGLHRAKMLSTIHVVPVVDTKTQAYGSFQ